MTPRRHPRTSTALSGPDFLARAPIFRPWLASLLILADLARAGDLPPPVAAEAARRGIPESAVSLLIQEVGAERPALAVNVDQPRNPASVIKLLTSLVALDRLGPAHTWRTEAYLEGPLVAGRLAGDLVIKGQGDPWLTPEAFWMFLRGLRGRGLEVIGGDLVLDSSQFQVPPDSRDAFDGQPERPYNALPDALSLNFQAFSIHLIPDDLGARVYTDPPLANLRIENGLTPSPGPCASQPPPEVLLTEEEDGARLVLKGGLARDCGAQTLRRLALTPAAHLGGAFRALWTELGGRLEGRPRVGVLSPGARLFHGWESRPLGEAIRGLNKHSNNLMARLLLLSLGAHQAGPPGTLDKGRAAVTAWLGENHLAAPELVLDNGSGLSRATRISAASLGRILVGAYRHPYMPEFLAALPVLGLDGTLRGRLANTPLRGRAHLKTGSLEGVNSLAGYLLDARGRRWVLVALIEQPGLQGGQARAVQDALLVWLWEAADRLADHGQARLPEPR